MSVLATFQATITGNDDDPAYSLRQDNSGQSKILEIGGDADPADIWVQIWSFDPEQSHAALSGLEGKTVRVTIEVD